MAEAILFDKHKRPVLHAMTAEQAWAACEDYEDHVYSVADGPSEDEWERMICDVRTLYDEYYGRFES